MRSICVVAVLLSGCATQDLPSVPTETKLPVGIPCLTRDKVPPRPDFVTDAQLATKDDAQLVFSLADDRLARQEYEGKLEATLAGCVSEQPLPDAIPAAPVPPTTKPWWKLW